MVILQFLQQGRTDGQQIASYEFLDFSRIPETRSHDFGLVSEFLVVVVDHGNGTDSRILGPNKILTGFRFVPIKDATHERRDQLSIGLGASYGLGQGKEKGHVAMDALLFQNTSCLNTFPSSGKLDQYALSGKSFGLVGGNQFTCLFEAGLGVKRQTSIHLGRNATRYDPEDFTSETNQQAIDYEFRSSFTIRLRFSDHLVDKIGILFLARSLEHEAGIRRGITRFVLSHGLEIAGVGHHHGLGLELVQGIRLWRNGGFDGFVHVGSVIRTLSAKRV